MFFYEIGISDGQGGCWVPFQSPEGDSLLVYNCLDVMGHMPDGCVDLVVFQSPEGDSLFFYATRRFSSTPWP